MVLKSVVWACDLIEVDTTPHFPIFRRVSREFQHESSYKWSGKNRDGGNHCLFQYTLSGCGELIYGQETFEIPPGTGLLCQVKDPQVTYQYPSWRTEPWEFLYLIFQGEVAFNLFDGWIARRGPVGTIDLNDPFLVRLFAREDNDQATVNSGYGLSIFDQLFRALPAGEQRNHDKGALRAQRAFEMMQAELLNNRPVEWFAQKLHVSREQLSRDFASYFSASPYQSFR